MGDTAGKIWIRFRYDRASGFKTHLIRDFDLNTFDMVAQEKISLFKEHGESFSSNTLTFFSEKLANELKNLFGSSLYYIKLSQEDVPDPVERAVLDLAVFLYSYSVAHSMMTKEILSGATLECVYEEVHGTTAYHVSMPGNIYDEKILSHSIELDMFLEDQRKLQYKTMSILHEDVAIIDEIIHSMQKFKDFAKDMRCGSAPVLFLYYVSQDFAPACSLVLGGRLDAAYAIARRSIEVLGMSRLIADDEEAKSIWNNAHKDEQSWKMFKKKFSIKNMFPRNDRFWQTVYKVYDRLAKEHHPNPKSFSRIRERSRTESQVRFEMHSMSFSLDEFQKNVFAFWEIVYIFSMMLLMFSGIVRDYYEGEQRDELKKSILTAAKFMERAYAMMEKHAEVAEQESDT